MVKSKQSNLIINLKMLNVGFIKTYAITAGLVNYKSLFSNPVSLTPPSPNYLAQKTINEILYRLLRVSIELQDFMIYQLLKKRTELLPQPHHIPFTQPSIAFALPISMPRFESTNFYQNRSNIKLFLRKKVQNFRVLKASSPNLKTAPSPPIRISCYALAAKSEYRILPKTTMQEDILKSGICFFLLRSFMLFLANNKTTEKTIICNRMLRYTLKISFIFVEVQF